MRRLRHLHRNDANAVLARCLEDFGQTFRTTPLKIVGARARLPRACSRRDNARALQCCECALDVLFRVDGAQAREHMKAAASDADAVMHEPTVIFRGLLGEELQTAHRTRKLPLTTP